MAEEEVVKVRPVKSVLTGTGTVWESILRDRGWNELPENEKFGIIEDMFLLPEGFKVVDVEFPALKTICRNIFLDEIELID